MKFKQKNTGVILETKNEFVIKQIEKSSDYEKIEELVPKEVIEEKPVKTDKKNK